MTTHYEWIVEQVNADGDIIDTNAYDSASDAYHAMACAPEHGCHYELGLTRNTGNNDAGLTGRSWAYVDKDGNLPANFTDGDANGAVPQRFHGELAGAQMAAAMIAHSKEVSRMAATMQAIHFTLEQHGSICLLNAHTQEARDWVEAHLPADRQRWGERGTVIEPRYVADIVNGIQADGLTVEEA